MIIAIDGASKRNGKPDCTAAGMAYCHDKGKYSAAFEVGSTNQRGELMGCLAGLTMAESYYLEEGNDLVMIVTDSEYVFNALYKDWTFGWSRKGWTTASGDPVKNQNLWKQIHNQLVALKEYEVEVLTYHIKGHLVSLGEVTANNLLDADPTGRQLVAAASDKYEIRKETHAELFEKARELFVRNNGMMVDEDTFKKLALYNTAADYGATKYLAMMEAKMNASTSF